MSGRWPPEWEDPAEEFPEEADQLDPTVLPEAGEARLSEVTAYLSSVPAPVLPDAVEARISAALAAEAAGRPSSARAGGTSPAAPTDATSPAGGTRTLVPVLARGRAGRHRSGSGQPRRRALLRSGSLVVVCLVLAGFGFLLSRGAPETTSSSAAAAAPAAGSSYASGSLGQSSGSVTGAQPVQPEFGENGSNFTVTESGTRYQPATLAAQVRARLAASGSTSSGSVNVPGASAPSAAASGSDPGRGSSPSAGLRGCVTHLIGGSPPRLVDRATYQRATAYIIASSSHVWVVGPGCTAADPELIASVSLAGLPGTSAP